MSIDFEKDATAAPTNQQLEELSALVDHQLRLEERVDTLKENMKEAQSTLDKIRRSALPDLMQALGYSLLRTNDGATVEIRRGLDASVTVANRPKAFEWLKKTGNDSIIKNEIKMLFTGKDEKKFRRALSVIDAEGLDYGVAQSVHPGTLKAFVREELEQGHTIDASITVFEYGEAKITR